MYEPREYGAECDRCPLNVDYRAKGHAPVPPETRAGKLLVIGEAPGGNEVEQGRPFVGASGSEMARTLAIHGLKRTDVSLTNALLCQPPGRNLSAYLRRLGKRNKIRKRCSEEPLPSPIECCRPRLLREIERAPSLLLLGATAFTAAAGAQGGEQGLARMRGFPFEVHGKPTVATYHPAFILRSRRWTETFRADVGKAIRYSAGKIQWTAPEVIFDPSLSELDGALERLSTHLVAVDTETDGLDPESVNLRCVGLGASDFGVVVGFRSIEDPPRVWRCIPEVARERIRNFFARARLCGHNINVYDRPVLERHGMPLPDYKDVWDTVIAHHVTESELPHNLDYLASRYTDSPKWKPSHGHDSWTSDAELHKYCLYDCANTARLAAIFARQVRDTNQIQVYESDVELQRLCVGMHRAGMRIDTKEQKRHEERLRKQIAIAEAKALEAAGIKLNLASPDQVRDLLFEQWGLPWPTEETDGGDPSTDKDALYEILQRALPSKVSDFIESLMDHRAASRSLNKDVMGLPIDKDGRIHPTWSPHTVITGRLSSSSPNCQNTPDTKTDPDSLRSMYVAAPGNVLVACDLEQLELRLVALLSGDAAWLEGFNSGADVHKINAAAFFSTTPDKIEKWQRTFAKTITYMFLYGGGPARACMNMRRVRDPQTGARPYARMTLEEARVMRERLIRAHPALPAWWERTIREFRELRYLREPILGRIRRFLDGEGNEDEARSEMVNFRIQAAGGSIMSGALACGDAMQSIGWPWHGGGGLGGPGIIHHGHDSLMVEVAEKNAERAAQALEAAMNRVVQYEGRSIVIPSKAKKGARWSELG